MSDILRKTKWWWGWEPEKIENWLEEEEAQGWHLFHVGGIGIHFQFQRGESRRVRYCVDYQSRIGPEYKKLFEDMGWNLVYSGMGWYIWQMEYKGERPEIYTEVDSLIERNNRLLALTVAVTACQLPGMTNIFRTYNFQSASYIMVPLIVLYIFIMSMAIYGIIKFVSSNKRLKERKR